MIENIIGCAEKEDAKALTGLFSQYAGESTLNLTEQAEEFIEFFQGECKSWKGNASSHEKSKHNMKSHIFIFLFTEKNRIKKGLLR